MAKDLEQIINEIEVHLVGKPFDGNICISVKQMKKWCNELKEISNNKKNNEDDGK